MSYLLDLGQRIKAAKPKVAALSAAQKDKCLLAIAEELRRSAAEILEANQKDVAAAKDNGIDDVMVDRLLLTEGRIDDIADAVVTLTALADPVGIVRRGSVLENGLRMTQVTVPLGGIGIIYESRPNVTVDAACMCLKSGNAALLRGGKEAFESNRCLVQVMRRVLEQQNITPDAILLVEDTSREVAAEMMQLNGYLDVLIPRGGQGLIQSVVKNATLPVIETGTGNCHIYVDATADIDMAVNIIYNAKTQRPSVCNAAESLLVHRDIAEKALPLIQKKLDEKNVLLHGCLRTVAILGERVVLATEEDYAMEYLGYEMSVRVVDSLDEAIEHIGTYSTHHSDAIVTSDYESAQKFTALVDSAAVYVNASTRFTDGGVFGFGAEIGISTQKLHARGPVGLNELTSTKFVLLGDGQVRE